MGEYTGYYKSDMGDIEIKCDEASLLTVKFVNNREKEIIKNRIVKQVIQELEEYF